MKVTINLPEKLIQCTKRYCKNNGCTVSGIIRVSLSKHLGLDEYDKSDVVNSNLRNDSSRKIKKVVVENDSAKSIHEQQDTEA